MQFEVFSSASVSSLYIVWLIFTLDEDDGK